MRIFARSCARRLGLISALVQIRSWIPGQRRSYEAGFDAELRRAIRPGDCVWDVGANLGLYTERFADQAGPTGIVHAFEPAPSCFAALQARTKNLPNVVRHELALGRAEASLPMQLAADPLGATHSLAAPPTGGETKLVRVTSGDLFRRTEQIRVPNVIKIDVDGFEEDVLLGLETTLADATCRAILCEVHFGIFEKRNDRYAPARIERLLRKHGFSLKWTDASHVAATR